MDAISILQKRIHTVYTTSSNSKVELDSEYSDGFYDDDNVSVKLSYSCLVIRRKDTQYVTTFQDLAQHNNETPSWSFLELLKDRLHT